MQIIRSCNTGEFKTGFDDNIEEKFRIKAKIAAMMDKENQESNRMCLGNDKGYKLLTILV